MLHKYSPLRKIINQQHVFRIKAILAVLLAFGNLMVFSKGADLPINLKNSTSSAQRIINTNDSIIFDLANATLTATYLDLPIYIISDDVINSFDYALKFNLVNLTYSTTIELIQSDPTIIASAYFNTADLFLRYTGSTLQSYPNNGIHITTIRFALSAPCLSISAADFTDILAILNGVQCSSRVTNLNFGKFIPSAGFITGPTCLNANVQFSDTSKIVSGTLASWLWTFDDGSTSVLQNPLVSYTTAGASTATLIVTASTGCVDTSITSLIINLPPISGFSYSFDCVKDSVFFTNTSTSPSGTIISSVWNFGDSNGTSNLTNPSYHYNASIVYTVTLSSTSSFSCTTIESLIVNLSNTVSANFVTNSVNNCLGSSISFSDVSTYSLNAINVWSWNFGDGGSSTQQNPNHTYAVSGIYTVSLTSVSAEGCKDTITRKVIIYALPVVKFGITSVTTCIVANAGFNDLSTTPAGSIWLWHFGNGDTSGLQNPTYSYSIAGVYSVKVVITTTAGCSDSLTKSYTVYFPPTADAPFSETILSTAVVSFSNLTVNTKKAFWDFGDGQNSILKNPSHKFPGIETYTICLTAYDTLDCIYTSCKEIYVGLARIVVVPSSFSPNDDNINDVLRVRGGPLVEMKFLIFNEWGNLLFSSPSQDIGWDGTFNGEAQPVGVYEYILKGKTADNFKINLYGAVNLTR